MINQSKRSILAVVVLHLMFLAIPISAFATVGGDQEIGLPQVMETPVKGCSAAILSPYEGRIYSLYEGVLIRYEMKPLKRVGSTVIDWGRFKDKLDEKGCRVGITDDKSKFVLLDRTNVLLVDASTGQILNAVERKNEGSGFAILNGNDLITLDEVVDRCFDDGCTKLFNLTIWDANTLQFKREIRELGKSFGFFWDQNSGPIMSIGPGRIYMTTGKTLVVLNSKTYAPELTLFRPGRVYEAADIPKISKNFQKLSFRGASRVTDHLTGKTASYDDVSRDRVLIFDQATREFRQETREFRRQSLEHISGQEYVGFVGRKLYITSGKEYLMSPVSPSIQALLMNLSTDIGVIFKQYESGEAVLTERLISGGPRYFQLTPGARKYLMMKDSSGKVVPINDATFAKYRRTESRD